MNANQRLDPTPPGYNPLLHPSPAVLKNSHQGFAFEMYQNHHIKRGPLHMRGHNANICARTHAVTHASCTLVHAKRLMHTRAVRVIQRTHITLFVPGRLFFSFSFFYYTGDLGSKIPFKAHLHGHDHHLKPSSLLPSLLTRNGGPTLQICWMLMSFYTPKGCTE